MTEAEPPETEYVEAEEAHGANSQAPGTWELVLCLCSAAYQHLLAQQLFTIYVLSNLSACTQHSIELLQGQMHYTNSDLSYISFTSCLHISVVVSMSVYSRRKHLQVPSPISFQVLFCSLSTSIAYMIKVTAG